MSGLGEDFFFAGGPSLSFSSLSMDRLVTTLMTAGFSIKDNEDISVWGQRRAESLVC